MKKKTQPECPNNMFPLPSCLLSLPATYFSPDPMQELQVHTTDSRTPFLPFPSHSPFHSCSSNSFISQAFKNLLCLLVFLTCTRHLTRRKCPSGTCSGNASNVHLGMFNCLQNSPRNVDCADSLITIRAVDSSHNK